MEKKCLLLILLCLSNFYVALCSMSFKKLVNYNLNETLASSSILNTSLYSDEVECLAWCDQLSTCRSVAYTESPIQKCILYNKNPSSLTDLIVSTSVTFYWSMCKYFPTKTKIPPNLN